MNTLLTLFLVQWEVESDVCTCGLAGWFNLSSNQPKNCQENGSSFRPGRDSQRNYLVAYRLTLTPQGKASHWGLCWPLEFSQRMMGAVFLWIQEPSSNLFCGVVPAQNEEWRGCEVSFQRILPNPGWRECGHDSDPRQGGDRRSFSEPVQPENPGLPCATGCTPMTYFSAPWAVAGVVNSTVFCLLLSLTLPSPSLNLEIILSFLVSIFFLCLRNNEMSWICHTSPSQQQVATSD